MSFFKCLTPKLGAYSELHISIIFDSRISSYLSGQSAFIGGYQALSGKGNCRETPVKGGFLQGPIHSSIKFLETNGN